MLLRSLVIGRPSSDRLIQTHAPLTRLRSESHRSSIVLPRIAAAIVIPTLLTGHGPLDVVLLIAVLTCVIETKRSGPLSPR